MALAFFARNEACLPAFSTLCGMLMSLVCVISMFPSLQAHQQAAALASLSEHHSTLVSRRRQTPVRLEKWYLKGVMTIRTL